MDVTAKIEDAAEFLEAIVADRGLLAQLDPELRQRFLMAAGRVSKPDMVARRQLKRRLLRNEKVEKRDEDRALLSRAGIRQMRENPIFRTPRRKGDPEEEQQPPPIGRVHEERVCYGCRIRYSEIHHFYDRMCVTCGDFNFA